jgi:hypothetical protein
VPPVYPNDRNQHPWRHFRATARGVNVHKLLDGTYTENQPADVTTVSIWYLGGHSYTVDSTEAAALTAAGYTVT